MKKINVGLYGGKGIFGGRETPLNAKIIYCDTCDSCDLYKENKCLNVVAPFSASCKYGRVESAKGYTSRAAKYYDFRDKYKNDEVYGKLSYPNTFSFVEIGDYYVTNIAHTRIYWDDQIGLCGEWKIEVPFIGSAISFIPKDKFTLDLLTRIVEFTPVNINYQSIRDDASVNNFLVAVRKKLPELYDEFVKRNPKYKDITYDSVGKLAYISTMTDGSELVDHMKNKFILKDGYLICDNYNSSLLPFNGKKGELKMKVTDDMKYQITDNSQVDENTRYF